MSKHKVVVGLGFGDEGKGTTVDFLTASKEYDFVLRFSGGPQAAHNVVTADGKHHTFSQFGSGTFNGVPTILTKYMLINPFNMAREAEALEELTDKDPFSGLIISENCLIVTPWHAAANQLEEIRRGAGAHGSCGQGIGVAQKFALDYPDLALRVKDLLLDYDSFVAKGHLVHQLLKAEYGYPSKEEREKMNPQMRSELIQRSPGNLYNMYEYFLKDHKPLIVSDDEILELVKDSNTVWEGSQGVLLDEWKGFHPYTTWSTTTSQNALQLLSEAGVDREDIEVIGVTRSYHTRHGAGPFPSEDPKLLLHFPEKHNGTGVFQGAWRVGGLDFSLLKYAVEADGHIDSIALTHMDLQRTYLVVKEPDDLMQYSGDLEAQQKLTEMLLTKSETSNTISISMEWILHRMVRILRKPVSIFSFGPRTDQKMHTVDTLFETVVN